MSEPFDLNAEVIGTTNELFYRNRPTPEPVATTDALYVMEVIGQAMEKAYDAGFNAALMTANQ